MLRTRPDFLSHTGHITDRRGFLLAGAAGAAAGLLGSDRRALAQEGPTAGTPVRTFTSGRWTPTHVELTETALEVQGAIPPEIDGLYIRNGHNPPPSLDPHYWFEGHGMLHGVRLRGGQARWYRNRYVRTPALDGARTFGADGTIDLTASAAATSVYAHAGRLYALQEVNLPYLIGPELETLGVFDFDGRLRQPMTAHPKIDPRTGEMLFISYAPFPPHLTYFRVSPEGELTHVEEVEGAGPSVMHDFAVTPNWVLFMDPSVVFQQNPRTPFPYDWDDSYQARIGIMPRDRSRGPARWIPVDPYYMFHIVNAWEKEDGTLAMDATVYGRESWARSLDWITDQPTAPSDLVADNAVVRWHVDPVTGAARPEVVSDVPQDFPALDQQRLGLPNRYTYAQAFPGGALRDFALVKHDNRSGTTAVREFPEGLVPDEPWFVGAPGERGEDEGWLLAFVNDAAKMSSALFIFDATDITANPVARVTMPGWVPAGVHGSFVAADRLPQRPI